MSLPSDGGTTANMRFWSTIAPAGTSETTIHKIAAPGTGILHLTGACFMAKPPTPGASYDPTFVYAQMGNDQIVVACLSWGVCETIRVELFFDRSVTFFVSEGGFPVQLTGCVLGSVESVQVPLSDSDNEGVDENQNGADIITNNTKRPYESTPPEKQVASKRARKHLDNGPKSSGSSDSGSSSSSSSNNNGTDSSDSDSDDDGKATNVAQMSPGDKLFSVIEKHLKRGRESMQTEDIARVYRDTFGVNFKEEAQQKLGKFLKRDNRFHSRGQSKWAIANYE